MLQQIWLNRFKVLESRINNQKEALNKLPDFPRKVALKTLIENLQIFASKQFNYFYEGFTNNNLELSTRYPPEYVSAVILEQVSFDLEAIQWAISQRQSKDYQKTLLIADKLGYEALSPAVVPFELGKLTVISYFQKFTEIRMIPYASVALLGIPYTCNPQEIIALGTIIPQLLQDYLAIPHEAGHYVYWHGISKSNSQPIHKLLTTALKDKIDWEIEWLEEVFADVYGCLIAGPVIAKTIQDLQLRHSQEQFITDDGEHPVPILRPDIYTKVILKKFNENWAINLNNQWVTERDKRDQKDESDGKSRKKIKLHCRRKKEAKTEEMSIEKIIRKKDSDDDPLIHPDSDTPLDIMIRVILSTLSELEQPQWWGEYFDKNQVENDLYELFKTHFEKENGIEQLNLPKDTFTITSAETRQASWLANGMEDFRKELANENGLTGSQVLEEVIRYEAMGQVPEKAWLTILNADGWATKGPINNPTGD